MLSKEIILWHPKMLKTLVNRQIVEKEVKQQHIVYPQPVLDYFT